MTCLVHATGTVRTRKDDAGLSDRQTETEGEEYVRVSQAEERHAQLS